jgi:tellurite resistance protein TerC
MSFRRAARWSLVYVGLALGFGLVLGLVGGWSLGTQFLAAYVVEKSLSLDNLFVFVIILGTFAVPADAQSRALTIGLALALGLRAVFIAAGAALLEAFSFMFAVFGLALVATAIQLFRHRDEDPSVSDNALVALARRRLPVSDTYHGRRLVTMEHGRRRLTPLVLGLLAIGTTDLLFALDSIPAVYGVTRHPLIVLTANVFALLGMRPLFFLVSGLLERLIYLSTGLSIILAFIGVKLVVHFIHLHLPSVPEPSTGLSLGVVVAVLMTTTLASLRRSAREPGLRAHAGSLRAAAGGGNRASVRHAGPAAASYGGRPDAPRPRAQPD